MRPKFKLITVLVCLFGATAFGQTTYSTSIIANGAQSYTVNIEIVLTDIVPVQNTCTWGYNYNVAYDYDIEILGGSSNLYTLAGYLTCGSNQGIFFDLPNNGGNGSNVTQGNPWTNNTDCATATVGSLMCDSISLEIEGPGIVNQTISLFPTFSNGSTSEWDVHGNTVDSTDFIGTTNSSALRFKSNNIERLRITEDGKVGIGTTEPTRELQVLGSTMLEGDLFLPILDTMPSYNGEKILFLDENDRVINGGANLLKSIIYDEDISLPATYCELNPVLQTPTWANGTNKIFSYCPQVKIGIGTNDPQKLLDVQGTTQTRKLEVGEEYSNYSLISGFRTGVSDVSLLSLGHYNPQTQTEHVNLELTSSGELSLNYKELQGGSTGEILSINSESDNVLKINDEGNLYLNYLGQGQALTIRS
jgi:hypothetical protein